MLIIKIKLYMKQKYLKIVLAVISVYHIFLGILAYLSGQWAVGIAKIVFGMTFSVNDQLLYVTKLLGIYALVFGIFAAMAAANPQKYRHVVEIGILLYVLRLINRLVFAGQIQQAFQVSTSSMLVEVLLIIFFGLALWMLRPKQANIA